MFFRKDYGLLGQNARNLVYIKSENFSISRKLADSKLKTKEFLVQHNVGVPATLALLKKYEDITDETIKELKPPFVIKPNNGYGGK